MTKREAGRNGHLCVPCVELEKGGMAKETESSSTFSVELGLLGWEG